MKQDFFNAATLLHDTLRKETDCFLPNGQIVRATQLVAIDDDITSAFIASRCFHLIRREYGYIPKVLCVGGKGLMSKHTHDVSEAELLAYVLTRLSVPKDYIVLLDQGKNSGENVLAVKEVTFPQDVTIWCCTQRLSLRLERTQAQQAPEVKSYWCVPKQSLTDVMRYYNGKGLCDGQMLLHELASILDRCVAYAGTFQKPLEFEVSDEVKKAAALLEKNFRLKLPHKTLKSYFQLIRLLRAVSLNKEQMKADMEAAINKTIEDFRKEGLIL